MVFNFLFILKWSLLMLAFVKASMLGHRHVEISCRSLCVMKVNRTSGSLPAAPTFITVPDVLPSSMKS